MQAAQGWVRSPGPAGARPAGARPAGRRRIKVVARAGPESKMGRSAGGRGHPAERSGAGLWVAGQAVASGGDFHAGWPFGFGDESVFAP